jgi:hypothetical protein
MPLLLEAPDDGEHGHGVQEVIVEMSQRRLRRGWIRLALL